MFVEQYLTCWNATEAAKRAGYSPDTAYSIGQENLKKPEISLFVKQRLNEAAMTADEVLRRLADMARGNIGVFMDEEGYFDLTTEEAINSRHLIRKSKVKKRVSSNKDDPWTETEVEIELHDPKDALVHLGRHHKLFTDKQELSGKDGGPIDVNITDTERVERLLALANTARARRGDVAPVGSGRDEAR